MNILNLAQEIGLQPKKVASTLGGEYKSACPNCQAGNDRFCIWPNQGIGGKYWCRQCQCHGDVIQFCRDFLKLNYVDACAKVNTEPKKSFSSRGYCPFKKFFFEPQFVQDVPEKWKMAAKDFIECCHRKLLETPDAIGMLQARGLAIETIKKFSLGWHSREIFDNRAAWGLPHELKDNGKERVQWLPRGIIIPTLENNLPIKVKIRRTDWHEGDKLPKYVELAGSMQKKSIYGDTSKPIIVLESEIDAILIQQVAADLCCCIALGGVGKKPDNYAHEILKRAPLILLALDYDGAGLKSYPFWMRSYSNLRPWPSYKGKSPGDSFLLGINLRNWVINGFKQSNQ